MVDYKPKLPDIFPQSEIKVKGEEHRYETFEGGDFNPVLEKKEYTLDKAPIDAIVEVTGILSGATYEFEQGSDYVLSDDNEDIVWQDDGDRPDAGSKFYVTYRCDSIISRYLESSEEQFEKVDDELQQVIESKFVDKATGTDLDELGKLFGFLGKRNGRDDKQYRIYLKSVVQSFVSRGTVNGIKLAVSAATDVPIDDISINEDFQNNEYEVVVIPNNAVTGSIIEQVAQIADPSGVNLLLTRFSPDDEEMVTNDGKSITIGETYDDAMTVNDANASIARTRFETVASNDSPVIDPNKFLVLDESGSDDGFVIDPNKFVFSDEVESDDDVSTTIVIPDTYRWETDPNQDTNWDQFQWVELDDLGTKLSEDTAKSDDSVTIPAKDAVTVDEASTDEVIVIDGNVSGSSDTSASSDTVSGTKEEFVGWNSDDWDSLKWAREHN